jgi:hypothetical protein
LIEFINLLPGPLREVNALVGRAAFAGEMGSKLRRRQGKNRPIGKQDLRAVIGYAII